MEKSIVKMHLKGLEQLQGKKLVWVGFDEHEERFYLFFEGMRAIAIDDVAFADDGKDLATKILGETLEEARRTMALRDLLDPPKKVEVDPNAPKIEVAVEVEAHGGAVQMEVFPPEQETMPEELLLKLKNDPNPSHREAMLADWRSRGTQS